MFYLFLLEWLDVWAGIFFAWWSKSHNCISSTLVQYSGKLQDKTDVKLTSYKTSGWCGKKVSTKRRTGSHAWQWLFTSKTDQLVSDFSGSGLGPICLGSAGNSNYSISPAVLVATFRVRFTKRGPIFRKLNNSRNFIVLRSISSKTYKTGETPLH